MKTKVAPTEKEMRESKAPWPKTKKELSTYIDSLVDRPHDYGTCVYAMSLASVATFNYVAGKLGVTGFQSGCADIDILRQTRNFNWGKLLIYDNLLFPQYCTKEHFPDLRTLFIKNQEELAKRAKEMLLKTPDAHKNVIAHWNLLAESKIPDYIK